MNAKVDVSSLCLTTKRLVLRAFCEKDLEDFYEYASVNGVGEMAGWHAHQNRAETQTILERFIAEKKTLALVERTSGKVIGSIGLEPYDPVLDELNLTGREIGYVLSKAYWGQGLMPEAVQRVIDYCFDEENYDFLACGYFLFNHRSKRVNEKLGFQPVCRVIRDTPVWKKVEVQINLLRNPRKGGKGDEA